MRADGKGEAALIEVHRGKRNHKTMQNFIFISPNFPTNYWQFCRELKNNGMNVLGIGDQPYDCLLYTSFYPTSIVNTRIFLCCKVFWPACVRSL